MVGTIERSLKSGLKYEAIAFSYLPLRQQVCPVGITSGSALLPYLLFISQSILI
ncbi:MAG: hypothetical protein WBG38_12350 [Nodosilinea sp.]